MGCPSAELPSDSFLLLTALDTSQIPLQHQPPDSENEEPVGTLISLNAHLETSRLVDRTWGEEKIHKTKNG